MGQIKYEYKNLPVHGGGYVTGFLFHEYEKNILYARTDIGGTYRFNYNDKTWTSLISHVNMKNLSETYPISVALNEKKPNMLYIACGVDKASSGFFALSQDYGETFRYEKIPCRIHGNLNGRGTDERLIVDKDDDQTLYFASQTEGLFVTNNEGRNWRKIYHFPETHLTFIKQVGNAFIIGTAGVATGTKECRGKSLYITYDHFDSFEIMDQPVGVFVDDCKWNGLVAQRVAIDDTYLYVTFASTGRRSYEVTLGYSCDCGDVINGRVARYKINPDGTFCNHEDITPMINRISRETSILDYGISGISISRQTPGLLICSTICKDDGDCIYRSSDYGMTWETILYNLDIGKMNFRTSYMKPEYNGGRNLIHWLSDVKINPFDDNEAWFNTGTGVFVTHNLKDDTCVEFCDWCDGIEETVHLNVYSLPKGDVKVIDILGDLGGFAFTDLDKPCDNSFADDNGNRYITCINADFSDENPNTFIVTPRGNWTGETKGGLIVTHDQGKTFTRLDLPLGLSDEIDEALHLIEKPNVNSGWVAMSPDTQSIVWTIADVVNLPVTRLVVSNNGGKTFKKSTVYDLKNEVVSHGNIKVFSDRVRSDVFYGFGDCTSFYISMDAGVTFHQKELNVELLNTDNGEMMYIPNCMPLVDFAFIDCADFTEIRGEAGKSGVFYIALGKCGLWKLIYDFKTESTKVKKLYKDGDIFYRVGLGILSENSDYFKDDKAIYVNAVIDGEYGFYRSVDDCVTFDRINNDKQMYGEINSIDGDCREFGLFYLATGSNGVKYGRQV